jgi:hypothetical protein
MFICNYNGRSPNFIKQLQDLSKSTCSLMGRISNLEITGGTVTTMQDSDVNGISFAWSYPTTVPLAIVTLGNITPVSIVTTDSITSGTFLSVSGTNGSGYFSLSNQSATPSTPTSAGRLFFDSSNRFSWIGTNGFVSAFTGTANTADRIYTLPDVAGTITVLGNTSTGSGSIVLASSPTIGGTLSLTLGTKLAIAEGANGISGQTTLVAGTKTISINGLTTSSRGFVTLVSASGTTLTTTYQAVCTANTLTLRANIAAGTINTSDVSVLNYLIIN